MRIALTGRGQDEDGQRAREAGFDPRRVKPAGYRQLVDPVTGLPPGTGAA